MSIFNLEIRNLRKSTLIGAISVTCVLVAFLAFFPSMQSESMQALAGAKLEGIDEALLAAFGLSKMVDFTQITNFFGYAVQYVALAVMVLIVHQATTLFIKEETDGTIEYLFSKPVSRSDIVIQKIAAHFVLILSTFALYTIVTIIGYLLFSDYSLSDAIVEVGTIFGGMLFVGLIFSSIGLLGSTLIKSSKGATGISMGLVFGTYILGVMSIVIEKLDFLVWFSPLEWVKTDKLINEGILIQEWIIGIIVIVLCLIGCWLRYKKKDLLV